MDISLEAIEQQLTIAAAYEGTARATQALARAQILATLLAAWPTPKVVMPETSEEEQIGELKKWKVGGQPIVAARNGSDVEFETPDPEPEEDFFAEVRKTHKK